MAHAPCIRVNWICCWCKGVGSPVIAAAGAGGTVGDSHCKAGAGHQFSTKHTKKVTVFTQLCFPRMAHRVTAVYTSYFWWQSWLTLPCSVHKALQKERQRIKSSQLSTEASSGTAAIKAEHHGKQHGKVLERNPQDPRAKAKNAQI